MRSTRPATTPEIIITSPPAGMTFFFTRPKAQMDEGRFNRLSLTQRAEILWDYGEFVDSVFYNHYCVLLYSIQRSFIELCVDLKDSSIVWITPANEYDLQKYLRNLRIEV